MARTHRFDPDTNTRARPVPRAATVAVHPDAMHFVLKREARSGALSRSDRRLGITSHYVRKGGH